ncbi:hypothetical protein HKX48_004133 [Thoreauomyces humboldtii]|nr:hypothetical protein HKX48_004133 [Thoreauomyces humboldtii]
MGLISGSYSHGGATTNSAYGNGNGQNTHGNVRVQNAPNGGQGYTHQASSSSGPGFSNNYSNLGFSNTISGTTGFNNNNNNNGSSLSAPGSFTTTRNPTEVCRVQNAPFLIENLRQRQETHITPHVSRERDETVVQQVVQPITDAVTAPSVHHHAQAPGVSREIAEALSSEDARRYRDQRQLATQGGKAVERIDQGTFQNAPVVKERVNVHVIEEIQPVIWRTIDETHIHHQAQPIYEHLTAAPKVQQIRYNPPISMQEFEQRGGSHQGTGLYCEKRGAGASLGY